jgi:hypothetical protein
VIIYYFISGDFLHPHLTVYETLACSAMLRLPSNLTRTQKMAQVESVIAELGLRHCRNTYIGNDEVWEKRSLEIKFLNKNLICFNRKEAFQEAKKGESASQCSCSQIQVRV